MNIDRLKVLVNIYNKRFDEMIGQSPDPRDKWAMITECAAKWDIEAPDFANMFAESIMKASGLIDEETCPPVKAL